MIRWLLDPNENHNLGNIFAYKLIQLLNGKAGKDKFRQIGKADIDKVEVTTEEERIDVLYKDLLQNVFIAIEVKQYSEEVFYEDGSSQLDKYIEEVKKLVKKTGQEIQVYYIYLTPLGAEPSNKDWCPVDYKELVEIIEDIYSQCLLNSKDEFNQDRKKIISDFRDDLKRIVNLLDKDDDYIKAEFNNNTDNKKLTAALEKEIRHGLATKHMARLKDIDKGETPDLKELILLIREFIEFQDHSRNPGAMRLARMIYNYLAEGPSLEYDINKKYTMAEKTSPIKGDLIKEYELDLETVSLTQGKGQGLNIYHKNGIHRVYMSGDTYGKFPNHGIQTALIGENKGIDWAEKVRNGEFHIDDELILEDKIKHGEKLIDFDQLMTEYVMKALKELSDKITNEY